MSNTEEKYCYIHPRHQATTKCKMCHEPLCELCNQSIGFDDYCPKCVAKQRMGKMIKIILLILFIGGAIGGGIYIKAKYKKPEPYNYGPYEERIVHLKHTLEGKPDNKHTILKLAELMVEAGDYQGAIDECKKFQTEQGMYYRLNWITMNGYKKLGNYDSAIVEVSELIENAPYDKDYRWWRGEIYEMNNQWDKAIADYKQSLALQPFLTSTPYSLSKALEQTGKGDAAVLPLLQLAHVRPEYRSSRRLISRVESLKMRYNCKKYQQKGETTVALDTNGFYSVSVTINDTVSGRFLFDRYASHVVLKESFANKLGLSADTLQPMIISTDRTNLDAFVGEVANIKVDSTETSFVEVALVKPKEFNNPHYEGIVGLSYLSRFLLEEDYINSTLHLSSKDNINYY